GHLEHEVRAAAAPIWPSWPTGKRHPAQPPRSSRPWSASTLPPPDDPGLLGRRGRARTMVEKTIELTGTSTNSIDDGVAPAAARAFATTKGIKPEVEIDRVTAVVEDGGVTAWRVRVRVSFAALFGEHFPLVENPDVAWALARAYNDWLYDFAA